MKKLPIICLLFTLVMFIVAGCKKDHDVRPGDNSSSTGYNKGDTSVALQDGRITLDIPAGAMKEGTKVSISSSTKQFVDAPHLLHQFELKPEGTKFDKPVTLTLHYDSAWLKGNSPWNIGIAYQDDEDGKWYPAVNGDIDTVKHTISIKTTHFSHWSIYTCFHLYMKADGQFSEDYSQIIHMQPGDIGLLLLTMEEPPAWKNDPDKSKEFGSPLVAPLTTPPIDPKESYSKSMSPDEWDVNGVVNGDENVGEIMPVNGAHEKLYQYLAPSQVPENNPVAVSATIHTASHGDIILIQDVEIMGKWMLNIIDSVDVDASGTKIIYAYHYDVRFHIDKKNKIISDGEDHSPLKFYKIQPPPPITSWVQTSTDYIKVNTIAGEYKSKANQLDCQLSMGFFEGTITMTICDPDGCQTKTSTGTGYDPGVGGINLLLKAESGNTFTRDTTITAGGGKAVVHEIYTLRTVRE